MQQRVRLPVNELFLDMLKSGPLSGKRQQGGRIIQGQPAKIIVFVVEPYRAIRRCKGDKHRRQRDCISIGLIKLLANVCGIECFQCEACFLLCFPKCRLPSRFSVLDPTSDLTPFPTKGATGPAQKKELKSIV